MVTKNLKPIVHYMFIPSLLMKEKDMNVTFVSIQLLLKVHHLLKQKETFSANISM